MALGTNYKRNNDKGEVFTAMNILKAQSYADQFVSSLSLDRMLALDLGAQVVLGKITVHDVYAKYPLK